MSKSTTTHAKDYPVEIRPLSADEGGGWLARFADLPGCMGDGATPEAAISDAYEAAAAWLAVAREQGDTFPNPVPVANRAVSSPACPKACTPAWSREPSKKA